MTDLSTTYLGLKLDNPFIVSSSSLTQSADAVRKCADAGAGAIVLKSLFEEQIQHDIASQESSETMDIHPDARTYTQQMGMRLGPEHYLELIEQARKAVSIPVIASLNCVGTKWWDRYADQLEAAGASAIELNVALMPRGLDESSDSIEKRVIHIVDTVRKDVKIPLAVKLGPYFTALPRLAVELRKAGASALVLFNRFYQLNIDIDKLSLSAGYQFSHADEIHTPLRWVSILSGQTGCELSASTAVHDGSAAIKYLLAGAQTVQVCSALYKNGLGHLATIKAELEGWMKTHAFPNLASFRGKLSQKDSIHPERYERTQYIKALTGIA